MWNLEHCGKVINVEVISRNGILRREGMMDFRLIGCNEIILIRRKVIMSFCSHYKVSLKDIFGRVNLIRL